MIWRVLKKAVTKKEALVLIFSYTGINYAVSIFVPWPTLFLVSFGIFLTVIWRVRKRPVDEHIVILVLYYLYLPFGGSYSLPKWR